MAPYPEDVDVFTVPHSRMKELVNDYAEMIKKTNFTSDLDLKLLLRSLLKTFMEFKTHEQIENQLIMNKLKHKLKQLSIRNTAVCNCHSDDQLGEMMNFIKSGYQKKTVQDRINYGLKLEKALEEFTCTFIPHMQEEEEVFQPLLLQYFSYEEIRDLKKKVIQQHLAKEEALLQEQLSLNARATCDRETAKIEKDHYNDETTQKNKKKEPGINSSSLGAHVKENFFDRLPPELHLRIFSNLNVPDLGHCAQVNWSWNHLSMDSSLWSDIYPVHWAQGDWDPGSEESSADDAACCDDCMEKNDDENYIIDDDADIDESEQTEEEGDGDEYSDIVQQVKDEAEVLRSLVKYILPKCGQGVKKLILKNSRALTNGMLNKIIQLCPNIEFLDLTQTRTSDAGLKSIGKNACGSKLKHVILSGCVNITDATVVRLAVAQHQSHSKISPACATASNRTQAKNGKIVSKMGTVTTKPTQKIEWEYCKETSESASTNIGIKDFKTKNVPQQTGEKALNPYDIRAVEIRKNGDAFDLDCLCDMYYKECQVAIKGGCNISTHHCNKSPSLTEADCGINWKSNATTINSDLEKNSHCVNNNFPEITEERPADCSKNGSESDTEKVFCHSHCQSNWVSLKVNHEITLAAIEDCETSLTGETVVKGIPVTDLWPKKAQGLNSNVCTKKNCDVYDCKNSDISDSAVVKDNQPVLLNYGLQYLNLSGCFQITDIGLGALGKIGQFPDMQHLDLSGCLRVNGDGLHALVNSCPNLQPHQLYYCDNIMDGPFEDTASGCQNLECNSRICCRSGE